MIPRIKNLCLFIVLSFSLNTFAQHPSKLIKTKFTYTFLGETTTSTIDNLVQEITSIKGVVYCKPFYKPEQSRGQIIVNVEEYSRTSEGQEMFDPTLLKKIIIKHGLQPNDIEIIELSE